MRFIDQVHAHESGSNGEQEQTQGETALKCSSTEGLWNKKQVAEHLNVTERQVRTLVDRSDLPQGVKVNSRWWWDPEVIKAFKKDLPQQDDDDDVNV